MKGLARTLDTASHALTQLHKGECGSLLALDLPLSDAYRLMALGFVPGVLVTATGSAPGGDPLIFRVDGTEVALRRETARRVTVERHP